MEPGQSIVTTLLATSPLRRRSKASLISGRLNSRVISSSTCSLPERYRSINLGKSNLGRAAPRKQPLIVFSSKASEKASKMRVGTHWRRADYDYRASWSSRIYSLADCWWKADSIESVIGTATLR